MLMAKKLAIALAVIMLAIVVWALFFGSNFLRIVIDGHELTGPLIGANEVGGLIVALIALLCAAILLLFVLAGIGVIILGSFVGITIVVVTLAFPFLLPLLIPLAILWVFVAITRRAKTS
jgi:hypothetical protein